MKKIIQSIIQKILSFYCKKGPKNEVYFESFHGKHYSDNPRAVYEQLQKQHPEISCVWGVKKGYEQPFLEAEVPFVYRFSKSWFKALAQSKVWVINNRTKSWLTKSPFTLYIQTWHGTPLKKIGLDISQVTMPNISTKEYRDSILADTKSWDVVLSPSKYTSQKLRSAFDLKAKQILPTGYPRNDFLIAVKKKEEWAEKKVLAIKEELKLNRGKKIILYAPTWRDNDSNEKGQYQFSLPFSLKRWEKDWSEKYILLIRLHYLVTPTEQVEQYHDVYDVSSYEEMSELLAMSDLLITDYSSCLFDYALLERPQIYYMYDEVQYEQETRGMYFSPTQKLPGTIVHTEQELWEALREEPTVNASCYKKFKDIFDTYEKGEAANHVVDVIINHMKK